ncbi:DMT family transporter [Inquilinus sp. Marseille-Q2685]|uniref:DMT family transporter n=1 Tax=Inquilinus sp. Marseille-Q2685 TaxID=2866581 RepID=UPI001CE3D2B5|nr:EamA family transporter [Inquilinus sp. Marseille-Q2685]
MAREGLGVAAALASSTLGGTSVVATRFLMGALDPATLGVFRFGIGCVLLLPVALALRSPWPPRRDLPAATLLGLLFFAAFPFLFNAALAHTTAARGALALSTQPLLTLAMGAALGAERLAPRKAAGVLLAMAGVALALGAGLAEAPPGAWRGDLLMVGAAGCGALYNVWSRPFVLRSSPLSFSVIGMAAGACSLAAMALSARPTALPVLDPAGWAAVVYLGVVGGALTFFLWVFALGRTTPTRVAISVAVNPVVAALLGVFTLDEPLGWPLLAGLAAVAAGIGLTATDGRRATPASIAASPGPARRS